MSTAFDFRRGGLFATPHLALRGLWLAIGASLVIAVLSLSVMPMSNGVRLLLANDKSLHLVAYAGLMGWFTQIFRHDLTRLALAMLFVTMGVALEFVQYLTGLRQFDVFDMVANGCGVLLAWALAYTSLGRVLEFVDRRLSPYVAHRR